MILQIPPGALTPCLPCQAATGTGIAPGDHGAVPEQRREGSLALWSSELGSSSGRAMGP